MQPPGSESFVSTLTAVQEDQSFTDETLIEDTLVGCTTELSLSLTGVV
jgi:hypothetical protein